MRRREARRIRYRPGNKPRLRMPRFSFPVMRRRRRYRVINRRRLIIAQAALALIAVLALALSASVIARSVRTAALNQRLVVMHTVAGESPDVEVAAPPIESLSAQAEGAGRNTSSAPFVRLTRMTMPDGSPIVSADEFIFANQKETAKTTVFHRTDLDILPDMQKLARENSDTVGWIGIGGVVYQPVVYRDNEFYLTHDFTGAKNTSGTLFLDENSPIAADTQNLLIHGHSMNDGSMFGILTHYRKLDFLRQHPLITFSTLWEKDTYAVFAVLLVSSEADDENYFNYFDHATFASSEDFNDYIQELKVRSKFQIPVDVEASDALLTLSTCIDDDRLVVVARRLRAGETKDELSSAIETAC